MPSPGRVLIVDDYEANITALRQLLEGQGYDVLTATNGRDALDLVHREHPDLVLLDVMMPERVGPRRLRVAEERRRDLPDAGRPGQRAAGARNAPRRPRGRRRRFPQQAGRSAGALRARAVADPAEAADRRSRVGRSRCS